MHPVYNVVAFLQLSLALLYFANSATARHLAYTCGDTAACQTFEIPALIDGAPEIPQAHESINSGKSINSDSHAGSTAKIRGLKPINYEIPFHPAKPSTDLIIRDVGLAYYDSEYHVIDHQAFADSKKALEAQQNLYTKAKRVIQTLSKDQYFRNVGAIGRMVFKLGILQLGILGIPQNPEDVSVILLHVVTNLMMGQIPPGLFSMWVFAGEVSLFVQVFLRGEFFGLHLRAMSQMIGDGHDLGIFDKRRLPIVNADRQEKGHSI